YLLGTDIGVDPELVNDVKVEDPMPFSTSIAIAVVSEATAGVTIDAGAMITASHDVTLKANAEAKTDIITLSSAYGFTFGNASPTATVKLDNGALITAANNFHMNATTTSFLKVTAFVPGVGMSTNLAGSGATLHATSLAEVGFGAVIVAANADVTAENHNK